MRSHWKFSLILGDAVGHAPEFRDLASTIRGHFGPLRGVDSELPPLEIAGDPPSFD